MQPLRLSDGWKALTRAREAEWETLKAEARAYATRVRRDFPDARVFLYGSVARGDFNLHSDIDLLVVAALPEHPLLTPAEYGRLSAGGKLEYLEGAEIL